MRNLGYFNELLDPTFKMLHYSIIRMNYASSLTLNTGILIDCASIKKILKF